MLQFMSIKDFIWLSFCLITSLSIVNGIFTKGRWFYFPEREGTFFFAYNKNIRQSYGNAGVTVFGYYLLTFLSLMFLQSILELIAMKNEGGYIYSLVHIIRGGHPAALPAGIANIQLGASLIKIKSLTKTIWINVHIFMALFNGICLTVYACFMMFF